MRRPVLGPSFASFAREPFASIVKMTRNSFWLLFVLAIVAFLVTIGAFPSNELEGANEEYAGKVKVREPKAKGKKRRLENAVITDEKETDELEILDAESNSWNHKHVRAQSRPKRLHKERRDPWGLNAGDGDKVDERHVGRSKRNATVSRVSKKGHKKLKLALSQPSAKTQLGKTRSRFLDGAKPSADRTEKKVNRRHVAYSARDTPGRFRSKRYAMGRTVGGNRADYYAQRRAVMERFYARQKEISEKYARKTTPSPPKYIHRYDRTENESKIGSASSNVPDTSNDTKVDNAVDNNNNNNNNLDTTTQASPTTEAYKEPMKTTTAADQRNVSNKVQTPYNSLEENNEEDGSDDYDYYTLEENKSKTTTEAMPEDAGTLNDSDVEYEEIKDPLKWGTCNGRLMYQHNVIITVHKAARADANISTSLEGPFCVTCLRVTPGGNYNATASLVVGNKWYDEKLTSARIMVKSFQDQTLVYTVKVWALPKLHNTCDYS